MISKQNIFSFRFVSTKWFTFTYRASQQMALDVTFTIIKKTFPTFFIFSMKSLRIYNGNPKYASNQAWENVLLLEDQNTRLCWRGRVWSMFSPNLLFTCNELCLLSPFAFWTVRLAPEPPKHSNLAMSILRCWFDPFIEVNVLMRQDNSHFRGGQWTLWSALSSPLR